MAGNVMELTNDWYQEDYYSFSPYRNPTGPTSGYYKVLRGGSYSYDKGFLRTVHKFLSTGLGGNDCGFRCVRSP